MALAPSKSAIVSLAETITKLQTERKTACARMKVVSAEMSKLGETLANCDKVQAEAQREMDRLAAQK